MTVLIPLLVAVLPFVGQSPAPTLDQLRARAQERMAQDSAFYSPAEMKELEELYQSANRDLRAPGARDTLQQVVAKYPKSNRAGSAVLYLAQMATGGEREAYLKTAVATYGDTWYGDGVQVGAFARAQLAVFYSNNGKPADAKALALEVAEKFPGAVDHSGRPLADTLRKLGLL